MENLLTTKNIAALQDTFDLDAFDYMDSFNYIMKLPLKQARNIWERFENIEYGDKRSFAKNICNLTSFYIQTLNEKN